MSLNTYLRELDVENRIIDSVSNEIILRSDQLLDHDIFRDRSSWIRYDSGLILIEIK